LAVDSDGFDLAHAVQVADQVWWVGHEAPGSDLNCHVYLIEQGDQSVLLDPGSRITFEHTLRKIEEVIPFSHIRWFICHHPDPDITASLPLVDGMIEREDARIVTHQRAGALIRHYGIGTPFWRVEEHQWRLQLPDRLLQFLFTPYAHFPGAFCTFDNRSGTLFSSNLFGGLTQAQGLFARDEGYFESIRTFHEHYIPSRDVLGHALSRIEEHPVRIIAPQHGAIIPERLVGYIINKLKELECGLYLMARESTDIQRLSRLNGLLKDITSTMIVSRDFREIADRLLLILQQMLPATLLEFYVQLEDDTVLHLAPASRYRGVAASPPLKISRMFGVHRRHWETSAGGRSFELVWITQEEGGDGNHWLVLPLFKREEEWMFGVAVIHLEERIEQTDEIERMTREMSSALQVAVERETIYRSIELERQRFYERSIRDSLTGLFTRFYMEDTLRRLFEIHDRNGGTQVALAMLDIDHFKRINDSYGHVQGDEVLRQVAQIIRTDARAGDLPVRLGGEEFGIFVVGDSAADIPAIAERLRRRVAAIRFKGSLSRLKVTISVGTAIRQQGETIPGFIERADLALYRAKKRGRNQVCFADRAGYSAQWSLGFE
jgi:diguanylate cyclase (GGDEF)-like protein